MLLALVSGLALAQPWDWYDPNSVARHSKLFTQAAEQLGPLFEETQGEFNQLSLAVGELELGVTLSGQFAPESVIEWSSFNRRTLTWQFLQIQKHVDLLQDDYARIFGNTLERTLAGEDWAGLKECSSKGIQALMGRSSCDGLGVDGSEALARLLDSNANLAHEIDEINAVPWPAVGLSAAPQQAGILTGSDNWFLASTLGNALLSDRIEIEGALLEEALWPLESALE
ncbi:MAG: hypothetical protein QGG40_20060, partial [Myxococcota bacterium]|nr:hypothetical protein [Myxococcota bacterium]